MVEEKAPIEPNKEENEPSKEEDPEDEVVDELEEREVTAAPRFSMFKDILVIRENSIAMETPKKEAVTRRAEHYDDELDDEIEEVDDVKESQDQALHIKDSKPNLLKYKTAPQLAFNQKDVLSTLKKALESTKSRFSIESIPVPATPNSVSTSPRKSSRASRSTVTSVVFPCMVLEPLPVTPRLTKGRSFGLGSPSKTKFRETMGMEGRSSLEEVTSPRRRTRERSSQERSSIAETPRYQANRSFQADSFSYSFDDVYAHQQEIKVADHLVQTEQNKGFLPRIPMKGSLSGVVRDDLVYAPPEELEGVMSFFSPNLSEVSSAANMSAFVHQISTTSLHNMKKGVYFPSPKALQSKVLDDSVDLHQVYEWSRLPKVHRGR